MTSPPFSRSPINPQLEILFNYEYYLVNKKFTSIPKTGDQEIENALRENVDIVIDQSQEIYIDRLELVLSFV